MKRLSPGVRFLLGFVTFLLCIALFAASVVSIALSGPVQILSSQENLESLLRQVLYADLLPSPQYARSSFASSSGTSGTPIELTYPPTVYYAPADIHLSQEQQTSTSMVEWIYNALAQDFGDELTVDLETVKDFVERSTLDDFLVEKGAALINDAYTGNTTVTLTPEEIRTAIEENAALIEEVFGVTMDDQVIADVTAVIEENEYVARIEEEGIVNIIMNPQGSTAEGMENPNSADTQQVVDFVRSIISLQALLLCIGACVLLIALILLVNRKQLWTGMKAIGWTLMLAALPFITLTVAAWIIPAGWAARWGLNSLVEIVVCQFLSINAVICFSVFGFGLLLMVGGIVVKGIFRRKCQQAAVTAAIEEALIAEETTAVEFPAEESPEEPEETEETEETV